MEGGSRQLRLVGRLGTSLNLCLLVEFDGNREVGVMGVKPIQGCHSVWVVRKVGVLLLVRGLPLLVALFLGLFGGCLRFFRFYPAE